MDVSRRGGKGRAKAGRSTKRVTGKPRDKAVAEPAVPELPDLPELLDPTCPSFARVPDAALPPGVVRTIVHDSTPGVDLLQGFLTAAECRHVIGLADDKFSRSLVFDTVTGEIREDPSRTSTSVMLKREQDAVVKRIEQRAAEAAGVPLDHLEPLQVVRYEPGQKFAAHHDYFGPLLLKGDRAGDRLVTIFVYLNDLDALELGGGTRFHVPNKTVRPKEGCAALWYNMRRGSDGLPAVDPSTLHSGEPLHMSTKYGINIWAREHRYR